MSSVARKRDEIDAQYKWDVESIFANPGAWETAVTQLQAQLQEIAKFKGRLSEGPAVLADYLAASDAMATAVGKIYVYASLNYSVDTTNQSAAARNDRARGLFGMAMATTAFAQPEMLAIGFATLRDWLTQDERLADYGHMLNQLEKQQAHVRSAEVEQVLGMARDAFGTASATHGILANADLQFAPAVGSDGQTYDITQGTIGGLTTHADREVRRTSWTNYADAHLAFKNTMANALASGVKQDVFTMRVRGYKNSLEAALSSNFIPTEVFHNLINTYKANLSTWHRYWNIRRRALGYDTLYPYDVKAPLSLNPPNVSYETAVDWIATGMLPLGQEYAATLRSGALEERWVDVYPNQGKRMGAFSSGVKGTHPFIMMSYTDDLFGLSTLAHELGHSMHSYLTWQNQSNLSYSRYGLFVAEVASNFNQAMVRAHLLNANSDPEFQISVIEEAMSNFHRYFFIMPTLARFELEIHERVERGQALNADVLNNLLADLFSEGFGDEVEVDRERVGITWAQFHTHMYSNFYVYQYATGISAAHALSQSILAGTEGAVDNYLGFLKAGGSVFPLDALKIAGVDMTSPEAVETTFGVLAGYVDLLEKLVAQRG
ncbi:MAG: oligoendopeptidase F [Ardenticatenaceae bacterium]|nr:oligoendopeptidase F [Anaerolineales bacterium]MCB8937362.1 oligoendopeptidase F [Ardenticatenaceae bacterium]MCB8975443.1 oligoendopeptidase F [Ardenticatenaceae bacterium]